MSNLLLMPGANGHRSASQRREDQLRAFNDHLMKVIAILTIQQGGLSLVSGASLSRQYDMTTTRDPLTGNIVYSAKLVPDTEEPALMPALNDIAAETEKEPT